jgi:hypothetical protein
VLTSTRTATPTVTVPKSPGETASVSATTGGAGSGGLTFSGDTGAPFPFYDTDWPSSGYYWTVIPVAAVQPGALSTFVRSPGSKALDTNLPIASTTGFAIGDAIMVGNEPVTITAVGDGTISVTQLKSGHVAGELVDRTGGSVQDVDLEMPEDVCASGRFSRFGKSSEPAPRRPAALRIGLSPAGRLTSALHTLRSTAHRSSRGRRPSAPRRTVVQ